MLRDYEGGAKRVESGGCDVTSKEFPLISMGKFLEGRYGGHFLTYLFPAPQFLRGVGSAQGSGLPTVGRRTGSLLTFSEQRCPFFWTLFK